MNIRRARPASAKSRNGAKTVSTNVGYWSWRMTFGIEAGANTAKPSSSEPEVPRERAHVGKTKWGRRGRYRVRKGIEDFPMPVGVEIVPPRRVTLAEQVTRGDRSRAYPERVNSGWAYASASLDEMLMGERGGRLILPHRENCKS